jgi:anti-sigma factor RsiW
MTCPFSFDDGAYVLGALVPAERSAFERHLPSCKQCRESVAALAVLPGLLGRLDATTAASQGAAPSTLLPRTLANAASRRRADRRRRRWYAIASAATAMVIAAAVGVGVRAYDAHIVGPPAVLGPMQPVSDRVPVSAEVGFVEVYGGTRVTMTCRYAAGREGTWILRLIVYPRSGEGEQLGTWMAESGHEVKLTAMTHLGPAQIARVELQSESRKTLLSWSPS